jgi:predicted RNase H-like nuclease (RuvC/YqgF family)
MESKTIVFGIVGLVLAGGAAAVVLSFQREGLKTDLRRKQADVQALEHTILQSKETISKNEHRIEQYRASATAHLANKQAADEMERSVARQAKALEAAKAKWELNVQMMQEALAAVRLAFRNQVVPSIPMKNGDALKDCRFNAIKEGMALFQHSAGTARLNSTQLPPELADRLRPNFPPPLSLPQDPEAPQAETNALAGQPKAAQGIPTAPSVDTQTIPPPPPNLPTPLVESFNAKQNALVELKSQISATQLQISAYQQLSNQATSATEKQKVAAALRSLQSQINEAESQIKKLQVELQRMNPS